MEDMLMLKYVISSLVYSAVGVTVLIATFVIWDRLTPYNLWKQICEEKNTALAIVVAGMTVAIGLIISSAIHG